MRKRALFISSLIWLILSGCQEEKLPDITADTNIIGLASGVKLKPGKTLIHLSDYFINPEKIEEVNIPGLAEDAYSLNYDELLVMPSEDIKAMMVLEVTVDGITESVPLFRSEKQLIEFSFDPEGKDYHSVSARGEFNGWTAGRPEFEFKDGTWQGSLMLNPGTYQYLLVADGEDMLDPANPDKIDNNMGAFNSVLSVAAGLNERLPRIFTLEAEDSGIEIASHNKVSGLYVFWQNIALPGTYIENEGDGVFEIEIPQIAKSTERSYMRLWAWNDYGISNDILIPLEYGKVVYDPSLISRHDHHSMVLYNAFVDRFNDADPTNNRPLNHPEVRPPADYHGGDIKGVTQKIRDGYFKALGVNTIWISPIVKNPESPYGFWPEPPSKFSAYHGYWPISFTLIDDRYGSSADLHELVKVAHDNNMNVLLDFVANHVHKDHPVYQDHPDWATALYLPDGSLNTERWDEYRLTTWFDVFLPTLDLSKPEVYEMLSDSAVFWIKEYGLDGFRHDATKHIPEVFWRALTRKLKEEIIVREGRPLYQIGETYGGPELIGSYVSTGMLDAQFDFNVYDDALAVLCREDQPFSRLEGSLQESLKYYGSHNLMGYISGNQDRGRFTSYAGGGLRFEEDAKLAGWTRQVEVGHEYAYDITKLLFAFNMTIPGLPVVYYGDEIGMAGGNDPDSRRMMRFNDLSPKEQNVLETVSMLGTFRNDQLALQYGDYETLLLTDQTYAYCRSYFDEIVIVVMNKSGQTKNLTFALPERFEDLDPESMFGSLPGVKKGKFTITLGARSFDLIVQKGR